MGPLFEFTVIHDGAKNIFEVRKGEYRNLMVLLKDKICPDDFGQCGGMGRCGTCLVNVSGLPDHAKQTYTNELNTLSKMGIKNPTTRLSCQIQIDEDLKNVVVELFDNVY